MDGVGVRGDRFCSTACDLQHYFLLQNPDLTQAMAEDNIAKTRGPPSTLLNFHSLVLDNEADRRC